MARTLLFSAGPLTAAARFAGGRQVVTHTREDARTLGVEHVTIAELPGSPMPGEAALRRAVWSAMAEVGLRGELSGHLRVMREILNLSPQHRAAVFDASGSLEALWAATRRHLDAPASVLGPAAPLLVAGYRDLQALEVETVDRSAADGSVVVLPQATRLRSAVAEHFGALGWTVHSGGAPDDLDVGARAALRFAAPQALDLAGTTVVAGADRQDECRRALEALGRRAAAGETVMIVVPDLGHYAPALRAAAWDAGLDLDLPLEVPMHEVRLGAWLRAVFEVLQGDWSYEHVLGVLGHALTGGLSPALRQAATRLRPGAPAAWRAAGAPDWLLVWPDSASAGEYADRTYDLLGSIEEGRLTPDDRRVGQHLLDVLDGWPSDHATDLGDFAHKATAALHAPLEPLPGVGLPVRTPEQVGGMFDHVWVLGLAEGHLPTPLPSPPLLDFHDRRRLRAAGVPCRTARDEVAAQELDFTAALGAARRTLTLSVPLRDGRQLLWPSAYVERLGLKAPTAVDRAPEPDTGVPGARALRAVEAHAARGAGAPHAYHGATGRALDLRGHTFSATQLTRFGQCPYRWYAQHVLGLHETGPGAAELLPHERGRYDHRVLELAGQEALGQPEPRARMLAALPAALERAAQDHGLTRRAGWSRQRPEHARRLRRVIEHPTFVADGHTIEAVERTFDLSWRGFMLTGTVDRLDRDAQGGLLLTDYKSGARRPKGVRDEAGNTVDVQLALYLDICAALYPELRVRHGRYLSLGSAAQPVLGRVEHDAEALGGLIERLEAAAAAGAFVPDAGPGAAHCAGCPLPGLCRHAAQAEGAEAGHE